MNWQRAVRSRDTSAGINLVRVAMRLRWQRYPHRFVDVDNGPDVLRRDVRWEPTIEWLRHIGRSEVRIAYEFELRESNDARRRYRAHGLSLGVAERW